MPIRKGPLWVVAFDGGQAKIFLKSGALTAPALELLKTFEIDNPPDHEQSRDAEGRFADGAGRKGGRGLPAGVAVGASRVEGQDAHEQAETRFIAELIAHLNARADADAFAELVVLGAPQALGVARPLMSSELSSRVRVEAAKDVVGAAPEDIAMHVGQLLRPD